MSLSISIVLCVSLHLAVKTHAYFMIIYTGNVLGLPLKMQMPTILLKLFGCGWLWLKELLSRPTLLSVVQCLIGYAFISLFYLLTFLRPTHGSIGIEFFFFANESFDLWISAFCRLFYKRHHISKWNWFSSYCVFFFFVLFFLLSLCCVCVFFFVLRSFV